MRCGGIGFRRAWVPALQNAWDTPGPATNHLRACFHVSKIGTVTVAPSWGSCENLVTFFFKTFNGIYLFVQAFLEEYRVWSLH